MLDNLATDGKENGGDRNLVLQQVTENSLDEANKQRGSFKDNGKKTEHTQNRKETAWTHNVGGRIGNRL